MKVYETVHRSEDGGHPGPNDEFCHGDAVYIVSKRELMSLLYRAKILAMAPTQLVDYPALERTVTEIDEILIEDDFIFRGYDLPPLSLKAVTEDRQALARSSKKK